MADRDRDQPRVADRWINAYNEYDFDTLELCAPDIKMRHHNREASQRGGEVIGLMEAFKGMFKERGFHDMRRQFASDEMASSSTAGRSTRP